jgi:hypothetical protein
MTSTTVLIYREWLQLLRYGSISVGLNRVIDKEAKSVQLRDLLTYTPEIDYRDKTSLIACEFTAVQSDAKVEICIEDVLSWIPLSQATLTDLEPEAERLKCHLAKCPWGTSYEEFVRQTYRSKLKGVLERWLSLFQLEGDFETANSQKVELPRIREISFPGKPFSGIYFAIEGHTHDKPFDLKDSAKRLKADFLGNQYTGFGGYPKQLEYADLLTNSKDQGFSLLALALLYTYTSLEKGLLDFCTFHNDIIWLSEKTSAQEALNVASIVGRHHGPEYMTGVYYSSSSNAAFVQDVEVTAYLATFQDDVAKRKQQSTGGEGEQNDGEAIDPPGDQSTDSSVEEFDDKTRGKTQQVADNDQNDCDSAENESNDGVVSGDSEVGESGHEQATDRSVEQPEQPESEPESESCRNGVAVTEPDTNPETDNEAAQGSDQSDPVASEGNQGTEKLDGGDVPPTESEPGVDPAAAKSDAASADEDSSDAGDSSSDGDHNDVSSLQTDEKPVVGNEHKEEDPTVGEQVTGGKDNNVSATPSLPLDVPSQPASKQPGYNKQGQSTRRGSGSGGARPSKTKNTEKPTTAVPGMFDEVEED